MVDVLFSFLCVLISIRCLGCSFKEIFRTLKDFLLLLLNYSGKQQFQENIYLYNFAGLLLL